MEKLSSATALRGFVADRDNEMYKAEASQWNRWKKIEGPEKLLIS